MAPLRLRLHPGRWRIRRKIVVPFAAAVISVMVITAVATLLLFNQYPDDETNRDLRRWLETVMETGYLRLAIEDPDVLHKLKSSLGVEVVASYSHGIVAGGTLDRSEWTVEEHRRLDRVLTDAVRSPDEARAFHAHGSTYRLVHARLDRPEKGVVLITFMAPMAQVERARQRMAIAVTAVTAAGILLVAFIGSRIAGAITDPIGELARGTRRIAAGEWDHPVNVRADDEIGQLAAAFNRMAEQLRESREKLLEAERLATAGQMAATFAHEVRNPLSSIRMMMQLAGERTSDAKTAKYVENTIEEIDRLNGIVEQMLDFSRPAQLKMVACDVGRELADVMGLLETSFHQQGIRTELQIADPVLVSGDGDALKRAFLNVLLNAIQAQPQGGRIQASVDPNGADAVVAIADSGPGFSEEALESLFRPFATTKTRGTGLGLVTTKRIIEQHGGGIYIENRAEGGAAVTIRLPLTEPEGQT